MITAQRYGRPLRNCRMHHLPDEVPDVSGPAWLAWVLQRLPRRLRKAIHAAVLDDLSSVPARHQFRLLTRNVLVKDRLRNEGRGPRVYAQSLPRDELVRAVLAWQVTEQVADMAHWYPAIGVEAPQEK